MWVRREFGRRCWVWARIATQGLVVMLLAVGGCAEKLDEPKPTAPDMQPLVSAYDAPNEAFTAETAPEILAATLDRIPLVGLFCGWDSIEDITCDPQGGCAHCDGFDALLGVLDELREQHGVSGSGLTVEGRYATQAQPIVIAGTQFDGEGFMRVERICDGGVAGGAADRDAHGLIDLIAGFNDLGLDPVVWGNFERCSLSLSEKQLVVDADFRLHWSSDGGVDLADLSAFDAVIALAGDVTYESQLFSVDLDVRALANGTLELRIPLDAARHVVFFSTLEESANPFVQGYRASNGTFTCDFASATCTTPDGTTLSL